MIICFLELDFYQCCHSCFNLHLYEPKSISIKKKKKNFNYFFNEKSINPFLLLLQFSKAVSTLSSKSFLKKIIDMILTPKLIYNHLFSQFSSNCCNLVQNNQPFDSMTFVMELVLLHICQQ